MPDTEVSKTALTIIHFMYVNILNQAFGKYFLFTFVQLNQYTHII